MGCSYLGRDLREIWFRQRNKGLAVSKKKKKKSKIQEFDLDQFMREIQKVCNKAVMIKHHPGQDSFEVLVYSDDGNVRHGVTSATIVEAVGGLHHFVMKDKK